MPNLKGVFLVCLREGQVISHSILNTNEIASIDQISIRIFILMYLLITRRCQSDKPWQYIVNRRT